MVEKILTVNAESNRFGVKVGFLIYPYHSALMKIAFGSVNINEIAIIVDVMN